MKLVPPSIRVFADSNLYIEGLVAEWSVSRAILVMARSKMFQLLLSPYVESEIEDFLLHNWVTNETKGNKLIDDYNLALLKIQPERLPRSTADEIKAHISIIRHGHDVPVLASATKARPDWLITSNIQHFNAEVAARTGLRIVTPHQFICLFKLQ